MARRPRAGLCLLLRPSSAPPCPSGRAGSTAWRGAPGPSATTSILSMIGECSGKMRSTPWPNDTLRTVNVARAPPRCMPITMPSNTWMRSLSPSRTFTCTRTVSPGLIAGRSTMLAALDGLYGSHHILLSADRSSDPASTLVSLAAAPRSSLARAPRRPAGPAGARASARSASRRRQRSISAWCPDSSTAGTSCPAKLRRPRVLRIVQQPARRTNRAPPTPRRRRRPAPAARRRRRSPAPATRRPTARSRRSTSSRSPGAAARARRPLRSARTAPRRARAALSRSASRA